MEHLSLDFFDDLHPKKTLAKIAGKIPIHLRKQEIGDMEKRASYPDSFFALSVLTKRANKINKFPIHDELNTFLSNEYFEANHHKIPTGAQKVAAYHIKKACLMHRLQPTDSVVEAAQGANCASNNYIEKVSDTRGGKLVKEAAQKVSNYALEKFASDGESRIRRYPIQNPEQVTSALDYFDKHANAFSPEDRRVYAINVARRASEFGMPWQQRSISKYAGFNYGSCLEKGLSARKNQLAQDSHLRGAYEKLAAVKDSMDPDTFAQSLYELDALSGIDRMYTTGNIPDPFYTTFAKTASGYTYDKHGMLLTDADLTKAFDNKYVKISEYFGSGLADGLKSDGISAFEALPNDAQEVVARIANGEIT